MDVNLRAARRVFDVEVGALVRVARTAVTVPCKAGCDACCHDVAWALEPEARDLAERARSMPTRRRALVVDALVAWFEGMRAAGLDVDDNRPDVSRYARAHLPCPLLDRKRRRCMVYDIRPLSCRGHYVLAPDASGCANRANEPTVTTIMVDKLMLAALVRLAPKGERRTMTDALLPRALARALSDQ